MPFNSENLRKIGNQVVVPLQQDSEGYLGRECPVEECLGYFKVTPGTGIKGPAPCHCPYCGHSGDSKTFYTKEQIEYARSVALQQITEAFHKDLKSLEFDRKPRGSFGIGISLKVTNSTPYPIRHYREKQLETEVICDNCTLHYAIYGVFGWCPDCGTHNSLQILGKNLELARKQLLLADTAEKDMAKHLLGDALENVVSSFDGFGREICFQKEADIRFQNVIAARRKVQETFGFDFADMVSTENWEEACRVFQKRHLLAHKMGVVDREYVQITKDPNAIVGRRVHISPDEVRSAIDIVETLGNRLFAGVLKA